MSIVRLSHQQVHEQPWPEPLGNKHSLRSRKGSPMSRARVPLSPPHLPSRFCAFTRYTSHCLRPANVTRSSICSFSSRRALYLIAQQALYLTHFRAAFTPSSPFLPSGNLIFWRSPRTTVMAPEFLEPPFPQVTTFI